MLVDLTGGLLSRRRLPADDEDAIWARLGDALGRGGVLALHSTAARKKGDARMKGLRGRRLYAVLGVCEPRDGYAPAAQSRRATRRARRARPLF